MTRSRRIVVATYNVHGGVGSDGRYDPHRIGAVIAEIGADVIALQEVDSRPARGRKLDQFELFERLTGFHAIAAPDSGDGRGRYGNVLLSRWPVRWHVLHDISVRGLEARSAIEAEIDAGQAVLHVVATHFGLRRRERRIQIEKLAELMDRRHGAPTVVMGDFNVWREPQALHRIGHPARPGARSWPAPLPLLALDRIWTRPADLCPSVTVHRTPLARRASDHLPVCAAIHLAHSRS